MQTFPLVVQTQTHERPSPVPLPPAQQARPMPSAETRRCFHFSPVPLLTSGPTLPVLLQEFHSRLRTYRNAHLIHSALRPEQCPQNKLENESLTSGNGSGAPATPCEASARLRFPVSRQRGPPAPAVPRVCPACPGLGTAVSLPCFCLALATELCALLHVAEVPVQVSSSQTDAS